MFYCNDAPALRAFLRDALGFDRCTDVGGGWLIFDMPEADLGVHPSEGPEGPPKPVPSGTAELSFYCDDIHATVAALEERGVTFVRDVQDHGYGWVTAFEAPGDFQIQLYQPKYTKG